METNERSQVAAPGEPPGTRGMALLRWIIVAVMALVAALSVAYSFGVFPGEAAHASETVYYCPMHPEVVRDAPGECPICSMSLVEKPGAAPAPAPRETPHAPEPHTGRPPPDGARAPDEPSKATPLGASSSPPAATAPLTGLRPITLELDRIQRIGVRTATAQVTELSPELRAFAVVAADEARVASVHARVSGWVEELRANTTGVAVARGQVLATLNSRELAPAQLEFLAARRWPPAGAAGERTLERDARARLALLGMSDAEIDAIAASGAPARAVALVAPISGRVLRKSVTRGAYVEPATELFEIADLSRVWVLADVYERDIRRVRVGQVASVELDAFPGEPRSGTVSFVQPVLDPVARTLRVRIEIDNPRERLLPGMYGKVRLALDAQRGLSVPADALIESGDATYLFVALGGGRFEPRAVRVAERAGDRVLIAAGLVEGEVVVSGAAFLIDAESRLSAAIREVP